LGEYSPAATPASAAGGAVTLAELLGSVVEPEIVRVPIASGDIAVLQYTGGTTGTPKGAMLTHGNIFANVVQTEMFMNRALVRGEGRYLLVIPYFHIYAFTVGMMMGVWVGALQVLIPKYDVQQVLDAIRDFRPTYFPAVPTVFVSLLTHPRVKEYGLEKVRTFNSGGAPCPVDVIEAWERTFGRTLNEGYGLSETSPVTHTTQHLGIRKPGTIGVPVCDTDIKIVDLETGTRELPAGEAGELCVSGPQVMKGYWKQPEESARVLRTAADGRVWFHTGDIGRIDEDGYTTIVQRKKDLIIVDGFNVYPSEVETVLYMHPDVKLAAVIGVPDRYHGEVPRACVVLREEATTTGDDLITHCKADLAPFKVPRQIEIRASLPMSAVGKILYRVLRDELNASASAPR
jgi:long-chain acyl-CoA synthetase